MQQQPPQTINNNVPPSAPLPIISTEQIQKLLDENKRLILAAMELRREGRLAECVLYEDRLQRNLTYLAQVADAQAQLEAASSQQPLQGAVQERQQHYTQNVQTPMSLQQSGQASFKLPFQLDESQRQHQQRPPMLRQQHFQGQAGTRANADTSPRTNQAMQTTIWNSMVKGQENKQDSEAGPSNAHGMS